MSPVIRIDDDVWQWLKGQARPLEDTPNSILRRVAGLDQDREERFTRRSSPGEKESSPMHSRTLEMKSLGDSRKRRGHRVVTDYGRRLNQEWKVGVRHALYHKDGNYYNHLRYFPGGLFDPRGYVIFKTEKDYMDSPYLQHGEQLHVPGGIASLRGYVRVR